MANYRPSQTIREEINNFSATVPNDTWIGYERDGIKRILLTNSNNDNRQIHLGKNIRVYPRSELLVALTSIQNSLPPTELVQSHIINILTHENDGIAVDRSYIRDVICAGLVSLNHTF